MGRRPREAARSVRALLPLCLLTLACAAQRPEPVGRVVFVDPPPGTPYPDASAPDRLANRLAQARARTLAAHADELFFAEEATEP